MIKNKMEDDNGLIEMNPPHKFDMKGREVFDNNEKIEEPKEEEYEPNPEWEEVKQEWYASVPVQFEIVKNLSQRETALIHVVNSKRTLRCLKINAVRYFHMNDTRYKIFSQPFNIYASLSKFPDMPVFSFSGYVKKQQQKKFNEEFRTYMTGFDFLMDIDNQDISLAHDSAVPVKKEFDEFKVPYWMMFSGSKGFHFRVDYEDFPDWLKEKDWDEISSTLKTFSQNFKLLNNLPDIDMAVYDLRRIAKIPYTVVYPFYFIALPLSDSEFENFSLEMVSLPVWMQKTNEVRNRGLLKRKGDKEGFGKLLKKYLEL